MDLPPRDPGRRGTARVRAWLPHVAEVAAVPYRVPRPGGLARGSSRRRTRRRRARDGARRRQARRRLVPPRPDVARLSSESKRQRRAHGARLPPHPRRGAFPRDERRRDVLTLPAPRRPLARRVVLPGAVGRVRLPHALAFRAADAQRPIFSPRTASTTDMRKRRNAFGLARRRIGRRDARRHGSRARPVRSAGVASDVRWPQPAGCLGRDLRLAPRGHRNRRHRHRYEPPGPRRRSPSGTRLRRPRRRCHEPPGRTRHGGRRRRRGSREQRDRRDGHVLLVRAHVAPRARPRRDRAQHQHRSRDRLRGRPRRGSGEREHLRAPLPADAAQRDRARAAQRAFWWWRPPATRALPSPSTPPPFPRPSRSERLRRAGRLARYSSFGGWLKFAAPECAPVTAIGGGTDVGCATSVASPLVAGIVGLLRTQAPFATADELEAALARTARPIPGSRHGLVDAAAALVALGRPEPHLQPAVVGDPIVGESLEAFSGVWSGAGLTATFQWERCQSSCAPIDGATSARYEVASGDVGFGLRVAASSDRDESGDLGHDLARRRGTRGSRAPFDRRVARGSEPCSLRGREPGPARIFASRPPGSAAGACAPRSSRERGTESAAADRGYSLRVAVLASNSVGSVSARSKASAVVR